MVALSEGLWAAILVVTMLAALGATFMAINFHLASGANHPWLIPKEGFDETIDVDAVLVMFQIVLFTFSGYLLLRTAGKVIPDRQPVCPMRAPRADRPPACGLLRTRAAAKVR